MGSSCALLTPRNREKELKEGHTVCFHITHHTTCCKKQILEERPALQLLLRGGEVQGTLAQSPLSDCTAPAKATPAFQPQRHFYSNHAPFPALSESLKAANLSSPQALN